MIFRAAIGPDYLSVLRYSFVTVPNDQAWYFGVPPNAFLYLFGNVRIPNKFGMLLHHAVLYGVVLYWLRGVWTERRNKASGWLLLYFLFYGLISLTSNVGRFGFTYQLPLTRLLIVMGVLALADRAVAKAVNDAVRRMFVAYGVPLFLLVFAAGVTANLWVERRGANYAKSRFSGVHLETSIDREEREIVGRIREAEGGGSPSLWSTYAGLAEWDLGVLNPSVDYIIHALGPEMRRKYAADFAEVRPRFVILQDPSHFIYSEWLRGTHWNFYEQIALNYHHVFSGPHRQLWERNLVWNEPLEMTRRLEAVDQPRLERVGGLRSAGRPAGIDRGGNFLRDLFALSCDPAVRKKPRAISSSWTAPRTVFRFRCLIMKRPCAFPFTPTAATIRV
ncbi:MAG: hypothetical protein M5R36_27345 [Deltaproteobacteria bacterium]|nr:hypothetical protein [Deltaproteobacteria bacterium]